MPPYFSQTSDDTAVVIGHSLTLECRVVSNPSAMINWLYNVSRYLYFCLSVSMCVHPSIYYAYICHNFYSYSSKKSSFELKDCLVTITATVYTKNCLLGRRCLKKNVSNQFITYMTEIKINEKTNKHCKFHSSRNNFRMFQNTYNLPLGAFLSDDQQTLTVSIVTWQQIGMYTCVASNSVGSVSKVIKVTIHGMDISYLAYVIIMLIFMPPFEKGGATCVAPVGWSVCRYVGRSVCR